MTILRRIYCRAIVAALSLLLGGCFGGAALLRAYGIALADKVAMALQSQGATLVGCITNNDGLGLIVECSYNLGGVNSTVNVSIDHSSPAYFFLDPLIVQVPASATEFVGTFSGPVGSGSLSIIEAGTSVPADLNRRITAEPGMKLVVLDFPTAPATNQVYDYELQFSMPSGTTSVPAKVLFTGKLVVDNVTYYPPLIPCETDFARIPQLQLPVVNQFTNVNLSPLAGVSGCQGTRYVYTANGAGGAAAEVPALLAPVIAFLALLIGGLGTIALRRGH